MSMRNAVVRVSVVAVVVVALAAFAEAMLVGFRLGKWAGEAHKTVEKRLAYKDGFEAGKSCKTGALGVPLGERCEVSGWVMSSLPQTGRDAAADGLYLDVRRVNGKDCRAVLRLEAGKEDAERLSKRSTFVGYETVSAVGTPAWVRGDAKQTSGYSVEHRFVIADEKPSP